MLGTAAEDQQREATSQAAVNVFRQMNFVREGEPAG